MFELVKLFRHANPEVNGAVADAAVKRKFLQGISPALEKGLFTFCNNPLSDGVSRDKLLQHCRDANEAVKVNMATTQVKRCQSKQISWKQFRINRTNQ